jgi:amidase
MQREEYIRYDGLGLAELVRKKEVSPSELAELSIGLIEEKNPALNAVICKMYDEGRKIAAGQNVDGPFCGVPFLIKDILADYPGYPSTFGSRLLQNHYPKTMTPLVKRYLDAGMIPLGKTNVPEFGLWDTTENKLFGAAHNPWDLTRTPGGSSGGSAAAVAARFVPIAHGNDGGGSIRIPAACCGIFGLKPSRGRMPSYPPGKGQSGILSDHVLTRTVRDSAAMLDSTCTPQLGDAFKLPMPKESFLKQMMHSPKGLKIALIREPFFENITTDKEVHAALDATIKICEDLGHHVIEKSPKFNPSDLLKAGLITFQSVIAEAVHRYRLLYPQQKNLIEPYTKNLLKIVDAYSACDFVWASNIGDLIHLQLELFFQDYDLILTPTQPHLPKKLGRTIPGDFESSIASLLLSIPSKKLVQSLVMSQAPKGLRPASYTFIFNLTGHPAMSVPLIWHEDKMPVGMQFAAKYGNEGLLLQLAHQLEQAKPWIDRVPKV